LLEGVLGGSFLLGTLGLTGCVGELSDPDSDVSGAANDAGKWKDLNPQPIENPPTVAASEQVPQSMDPLEGDERCTDLAEGEHLLGVSPNGIAWIANVSSDSTAFRVADFRADSVDETFDVELGGILAAQILGVQSAAFLTEDALWSFDDGTLQPHPLAFEKGSGLCGDPYSNGAVLAAGRFMERRATQWWSWEPSVSEEVAVDRLIDVGGECYDRDDGAWMLGADDRLWRVSRIDTQLLFSDVHSVDANPAHTGVLTSEGFYFGRDDWQHWTFPEEIPERVVAGGEVMWLQGGSQLLRFDGESFRELSRSELIQVDGLHAHAGGLWLEGEGRLCHYETQESLRVHGIRPGERAERESWTLEVELAPGESEELQASLNGDSIELAEAGSGASQLVDIPSARVGWNEVRLLQGAAERSVFFKREPAVVRSWADEIAPISDGECIDCHSPGGDAEKFPLETYEQWLASASDIRKRVVETETMPPTPPVGWEEQAQIIAEWLEGGMNP